MVRARARARARVRVRARARARVRVRVRARARVRARVMVWGEGYLQHQLAPLGTYLPLRRPQLSAAADRRRLCRLCRQQRAFEP